MSLEQKPGLQTQDSTDAKVERVKSLVRLGVTVVRACAQENLPRPTFYFKVPPEELRLLRNEKSSTGGPMRPPQSEGGATPPNAMTSSSEHELSQQSAPSVSEPEPGSGDAVGVGNRLNG